MNPETKLQRLIMLALSQAGHTVFRNETGRFWTGRVIHKENTSITLANAIMIPCGLAVGSCDLIGIQAGTGRFFGIEVKTKTGRASKEQVNFMEQVNKMGGLAGIARTPEEALNILK